MTDHSKETSLLFKLSHSAVRLTKSISAIATVTLAVLIPLATFYPDEGLALVQKHFAEPASYYPTGTVAALLAMVLLITGLSWQFLVRLERVAKSTLKGSPFVEKNASHLLTMAWLILAISLAHFPAATLGLAVETAFKGPTSEVELSFDTVVFLAIISAFMVGAVFRQGIQTMHSKGSI